MRKASPAGRGRFKAGLPPGTPVYIGDRGEQEVRISIIEYNESGVEELTTSDVNVCFDRLENPAITWINFDGVHKLDIIGELGHFMNWHPLLLEDLSNTQQRPKMEDYGDYVFIVLKMLSCGEISGQIKVEQVSLILGKGYVVSFQEKPGDVFDVIRNRIRSGKGRIRRMESDYLAYSLIDTIVDNYFLILEKTGEVIENMEDMIVSDPQPETLQSIHKLKRDLIDLRRSVWPLRELINGLERTESKLITKETQIFLRDVYDHTIQVIDSVETYRDIIAGMHDTYLSSISNKMNQIMKVLTIIATFFIPLTFIAGVYGMNFKFMPELDWKWGYPLVWGVMLAVSALMFIFFKRRRWF